MHMRAEPVHEGPEIAARQRVRQVGRGDARRVEELRRPHRAEGVAGKIAPGAVRPVDVLQTAAPVVGRADAEQPLQAVAPGVREIPEIEVALDRSEEHTSELQSLMRTSYAVFC